MTDPAPNLARQPSPGVQPPSGIPTPVAETFTPPTEAEPLPPVHEEEEGEEEAPPRQQHEPPRHPPQPPPFQPLFTLVTDSTTRATHHPRVHYIFSDDDSDILTETLAHYGPQKQTTSASPSGSGTTLEGRERPRQPSTSSTTPVNERVIILDLVPKDNNTTTTTVHPDEYTAAASTAAGGYDVAWASSLSSDWAVVSARISPMADDINASSTTTTAAAVTVTADPDGENPQQQLVLRIEGLGLDAAPPSSSAPPPPHNNTGGGSRARDRGFSTATATLAGGRRPSLEERDLRMSGSSGAAGQGQGQVQVQEDYAAITDEFNKRMGVLRRVLDAGMERQRWMAAAEDEGEEEGFGLEGLPFATHAPEWGAVVGGGEQGEGVEFVSQPQPRLGRAKSSTSMRPSEGGE